MDPLDITNESGPTDGLPDSPHVEIMFDALNDTLEDVAGNEGMSLTSSQIYAKAVLGANSVYSVTGNESFFGTIKDGAKAVYDYIIKMFKSVYGFFFNRDVAKEVEAAKVEVKESQGKLEELKRADPESAAYAATFMGALHTRVAQADSRAEIDIDKDTIEQIQAKLKGSASDKKAGVTQMVNAMPKANKKAQEAYTKANAAAIDAKSRLVRVIEAAQKSPLGEPVTGVTGYVNDIGVSIVAAGVKSLASEKAFISMLEKHKTIGSIGDATALAIAIIANLDSMKSLGERYKGHTSRISGEVKDAEKALKEGTDHGATKDHVNKKRLDGLRNILTFSTNIAQGIKKSIAELERLQKASAKIFGV